MDPSKYVIYESGGFEHVILFASWEGHGDAIGPSRQIVAAGFFRLSAASVTRLPKNREARNECRIVINCWGKSISLGVRSRGVRDEQLILNFLGIEK